MNKFFPTILLMLNVGSAHAALQTKTVEYRQGGAVLQGLLTYDDSLSGPRPGVLVIHEWTGLNDYVKRRAQQLAALGYVAFAADIYGKGVRPQTVADAAAVSAKYRGDRGLLRARAQAGLAALKSSPGVDPARLAAIGYCFGGGAALELARSGADLKGVVSFHGSLDTPKPEDARDIKGRVLVLHGGADPFVPFPQLDAFRSEMEAASVDYQLVVYGGAQHSFTNPVAEGDPAGARYDAQADARSWEAMQAFLAALFN